MSRRMLMAAALLILSQSVAQAQAGTVKQQGGTSSAAAKAAINKMWDEVVAAAKRGDAAALTEYYADDAILVDPGMATVNGKANIGKATKEWLSSMKFLDMTRKQTNFELFGDIAIENGTFVQTLQEKGKAPMKNEGRYTMVFKNVNGKWLVIRDVTVPMPPAPKKM